MTTTIILTKSEIFTIYNQMRAAARREGDTKKVERLNKALGILQTRAYYTDERADYAPSAQYCGCKDWEFRFAHKRAYAGPCKHILAEQMVEAIIARRQEHEISRWFEAQQEAKHVLESSYRI